MSPSSLVRSLYLEIINPRRLDALPDVLAEDFIGPDGAVGVAAYRATIGRVTTAFPDVAFEIDDLFEAGDKATVRWHFEARHDGPMGSPAGTVAATGRMIRQDGIGIYHAADGRLRQAWLQVDRLGALQQMGAA